MTLSPGQSMRSALTPIVDAVLLARESSALQGVAIDGDRLAGVICDVYPFPDAQRLTADQYVDYCGEQLGAFLVAAVVLTSQLVDRLCSATGNSAAEVLRSVLDDFPAAPPAERRTV